MKSIQGPVYKIVKLLAKIAPSKGIHSDVDEELLGNPESVLPYNDDPLVFNKISFNCAVDGYDTGFALRDGTIADKGLTKDIPTLLMIGSEDKICAPQGSRDLYARLKEAGDNIGFIEWENLYHEIHNGGPESNGDEVIERIVQYVLDPTDMSQPA